MPENTEQPSPLDKIIDRWVSLDYALLYMDTGGCQCYGTHAPCHFCITYDWDGDPLNLLQKE